MNLEDFYQLTKNQWEKPSTNNYSTNNCSTNIVNCKVGFIRPEYNNLKEWIDDKKNVYIGRKGVVFVDGKRFPEENSIFANPYKVGKDGTREVVIDKYKKYIEEKMKTDKTLVSELKLLKGKNLGCWCYPEKCHGNVLVELCETC